MCYVHNQWYDISCATLYKTIFFFADSSDLNFTKFQLYKEKTGKKSNIILVYNLLYATESFLSSQSFLSQSRYFPHFMEPGGSLPHAQ